MNSLLKTPIALALSLGILAGPAFAGMDEARQFLDKPRSVICRPFPASARKKKCSGSSMPPKPFAGMKIKVVSETLATHELRIQGAGAGLFRDYRH